MLKDYVHSKGSQSWQFNNDAVLALLQHEHKIAVQGTESNELHRYYLGPFHSSFAHEVQYHKLIPSLEIQPPLLNSEATFMSSSV